MIHGIAVREGIAVFTVELKDHCRDVLIAAGGGGGDVFNIQSENLLNSRSSQRDAGASHLRV